MKWIAGILATAIAAGQGWSTQQSGTSASLRGVKSVSATVVWASGSNGTFLRTLDGGATWSRAQVASAADADFRGLWAFDADTAYLLSIGEGEKSRVYKTGDGGSHWDLLYTNPDPTGFFDAIAFWDTAHGILLGDPVKGRFLVMTTEDGGVTWKRQKGPSALANEGAFAASNSCLVIRGAREAWFATGGSRVFHSTDGGETWSVAKTPILHDSASAGIFSLAFAEGARGVAVGGDYKKTAETSGNAALTSNAGKSWAAPATPPNGYRSAAAYLASRKMWISVGTSGSDVSVDDGTTWQQFDSGNFNALSFSGDAGWAVGPKGAIARFKP
jgi:photosystem II stability/assembly factor-like uncharacterized protein